MIRMIIGTLIAAGACGRLELDPSVPIITMVPLIFFGTILTLWGALDLAKYRR
jgi:hypothetical protein